MDSIETKNTISQRVSLVPPSGIRKFFDLLTNMEGVISLGIGEPDYATPWHISEAAIYSLEKGYTMYTGNSGLPELRQRIANYLHIRYGVEYNPDTEILVTVGVSEALDLVLRAILNPGDQVIVPDPGYVAYSADVILAGGEPVLVPITLENEFKLPAQDVAERITERTKAIIMGYPANPTGAVMSRRELAPIAELAAKRDLLVISDEVYGRLVYGVKHTCVPTLPKMRERTILLNGFSKAYAMTGWRLGYAAAPAHIIAGMNKIHQYTIMCAPTMAQVAAIEALKSGDEEVEAMVADYDRRRRVMVQGLCEIGLSCYEPKGAFYCFPSVKSAGLSSEVFAERLLYEEKVAVVPGTAFGPNGEGHVRCCYATSLSDIQEALKRIGHFVDRVRRG
jgi:aminotransferase